MALHCDKGSTAKQSFKDIFLPLPVCFTHFLSRIASGKQSFSLRPVHLPLWFVPDCANFDCCFFHFITQNQGFTFLFTSLNQGEGKEAGKTFT